MSKSASVITRYHRHLVLACIIFILFFYSTYNLREIQIKKTQIETKEQIFATQQESRILPVRLEIPSIRVDAAIQRVGVTVNGEMAAPDNTTDVGWFDLGPLPGETGNAVISGHFDGRNGESGVFNKLDKLKQGDKIYITNEQEITVSFVVRESRYYSSGYATEVFLPTDNNKHLNLITCDGVWNEAKKSYSKRLVVFADIAR